MSDKFREYVDLAEQQRIDTRIRSEATAHEIGEFRQGEREVAERRKEALRVYEPLPFQDAFHGCKAKEAIIRKGNQVGGSTAAFVEVARAATAQDPFNKYPKEDGTIVCVGWGEKHIATVMHRLLLQKGAFRIIKDKATREWRTFRPWPGAQSFQGKPGDAERELESRPAPPLIPKRFIKPGGIAWESRAKRIFSHIELTTGWMIRAYNSAGDPEQVQGFQVNLCLFDEDVATGGWYQEMVGRTSMTKGLIRWNAVPHEKTDDMMKMLERAEDEAKKETPQTVCIEASIFENPYMPEETRQQNIRIWQSEGEDVYRRRALGQLTTGSVLMYPGFSKYIHCAVKHEAPMTPVQKMISECGGAPPDNWCRYMTFDPGHTVGAALFFAVPPPSISEDQIVVYDELYMTQCDVHKFGEGVQEKAHDKTFQEFIIDSHGGNLRELASGILPRYQYEAELKTRGIRSIANGPYFVNGSDDVKGREAVVRDALRVRGDGTTKLLIVVERCPNLVTELIRFKKKTVDKNGQRLVVDEGERRSGTHAVECLEYGLAHGLRFVLPPSRAIELSSADRVSAGIRERELQRRFKNGPSRSSVSLGPVGAR